MVGYSGVGGARWSAKMGVWVRGWRWLGQPSVVSFSCSMFGLVLFFSNIVSISRLGLWILCSAGASLGCLTRLAALGEK